MSPNEYELFPDINYRWLKGFFSNLALKFHELLYGKWRVKSLSRLHKPSQGKHNCQTEFSASIRGTMVFKQFSFIQPSSPKSLWYSGSALVVVSWRTFWQQMTAPRLEMRRLKDCSSLLANNGQVYVSEKWKTRARKVIFMSQNAPSEMKKADRQIQLSTQTLKIFIIPIYNT